VSIDLWAIAVTVTAWVAVIAAEVTSIRYIRSARRHAEAAAADWRKSLLLAGLTLKLCQAIPLSEAEQQLYDELTALEEERTGSGS
jgi:hypothetical protein